MSAASSKTQNPVSNLSQCKRSLSLKYSSLSGNTTSYPSKFKILTHLNLNGSNVGKQGVHLLQIIDSLGPDSPLQLLYLRNCSIPSDILQEILKNLKKCKQLTHLDLGFHNLENAGENLVELIKSFGQDPPLQQLYLPNCSIPEVDCTKILSYLSECRYLTCLDLSENKVGKAGKYITDIVVKLGLDSPLQLLYLRDCSISADTLQEILKCLKRCKQLTHLDLGGHCFENDGDHLVEVIKSLAIDPILQQLHLGNCSMLEKDCTEMLRYLSEFRHLTHLNLNENIVGKAGSHIAEMVERAGLDSPLQLLYLRDCSISADTLREILKCLKRCKQLTHLDLSGHSLKNYGDHLIELIKSFRIDLLLQQLYLGNCSILENNCTEMLQYLSQFRHLTHLNLYGNKVGKAGSHIAEMVGRAGLDSPLQVLYLRDCSISADTLREILK